MSCGVAEVLASIWVTQWASINCFLVEGRRATRHQSIGRCILQMMTGTVFFIGGIMIVPILYKLLFVYGTSYSFII